MSNTVLTERDGAIVTVTLNRPDKLNALNEELLVALGQTFADLTKDATVSCAILTGAGEKAFAAGADIGAMLDMTTERARFFSEVGHRICSSIERAPFPVIGAVNGFALGGGCEIALACDFLYASDKAKLGQPEVNLGIIPGFGGTQRLARRVGIGRARELCYTGDTIGAEEALRIGLVNGVVAGPELLAKVKDVAGKIAKKGRVAIAQCKRVLYSGADVPLDTANALETQAFAMLFGTNDRREGMSAFLEKRAATFTGT
ncbi:MAG: enoyl-CoA hydratase/isomerase family protein [Labilithrix sp.]|nr:enoyl-CoA hydratase/isomerase family protein [Labilithrix sp.]MCW5814677.1 enoyl-CoA hydratase/isomerase family protein [Labilithrix sp.]